MLGGDSSFFPLLLRADGRMALGWEQPGWCHPSHWSKDHLNINTSMGGKKEHRPLYVKSQSRRKRSPAQQQILTKPFYCWPWKATRCLIILSINSSSKLFAVIQTISSCSALEGPPFALSPVVAQCVKSSHHNFSFPSRKGPFAPTAQTLGPCLSRPALPEGCHQPAHREATPHATAFSSWPSCLSHV